MPTSHPAILSVQVLNGSLTISGRGDPRQLIDENGRRLLEDRLSGPEHDTQTDDFTLIISPRQYERLTAYDERRHRHANVRAVACVGILLLLWKTDRSGLEVTASDLTDDPIIGTSHPTLSDIAPMRDPHPESPSPNLR